MSDFERQLRDYRLTTVGIVYRMPDYPILLQTFLWQCLDLPPEFPRVGSFLGYWEEHIKAQIHQVEVTVGGRLVPVQFTYGGHEYTLH